MSKTAQMRSAQCRIALFLLVAALGALWPARAIASVYPAGIEIPGSSGVSDAVTADSCCWLYRRARLLVQAPARSDTLLITIFIPGYAILGKPQSFSVRVDDGPLQARCCYEAGLHVLAIHVAPVRRDRVLRVTIVPQYTFVPADLGMNDDTRHLSVMLRSVAAANGTYAIPPPGVVQTPRDRLWIGVLLALSFVVVTVLALRRPVYAAAALILTDPFAFYLYVGHTSITLPKVVLIGAALGIGLAAVRRVRPGPAGIAIAAALGLLIASMVISSLHAFDHSAALRETLKAVQYLATLAVAYAAYRLDPDERLIRGALVVITIVTCALALAQLVLGAPESATMFGYDVARVSGPIGGPNQLAGFLGVVLPMIIAWMLREARSPLMWCALAEGAVALLLTFSRGGQAALVIATALLIILAWWPAWARAAGGMVAGAWAAFLAVTFAQFAGAVRWDWLFGRSHNEAGLGTRAELWSAAYRLWRSSPWVGIGPANFELEVSRYYPGLMTHANSVYFNTLAEQGVLGEASLGVLLLTLVLSFARRFREPLALGALGIVTAMAFHQIVDTIWIYPKVGVIFWAMLGIAAASVDSART